MILAALILFAVGAADAVRQYSPRARWWIPMSAIAVVLVVFAALANAVLPALAAVAVAAAWLWLMPARGAPRAGLWSAAALALICAVSVLSIGARTDAGVLSALRLATPAGDVSVDQIVLVVGAITFLVESANVIVRASLQEAHVPARAVEGSSGQSEAAAAHGASPGGTGNQPALRGGRMIGPVERVLVFAMTLSGAYALLAAVLAAKGIVRFPEISRDAEGGSRAEYFLIGSLVSWLIALAAALLVWWSFSA